MATRKENVQHFEQSAWQPHLTHCGSVAHWVLHQDLEIHVRLCSWHSRKRVGRDDKLSFRAIMRWECFFNFPTKAGIFQDSVAEVQALTATVSGAPKDLKTNYFILLALNCLQKFHSGTRVWQQCTVYATIILCVCNLCHLILIKKSC